MRHVQVQLSSELTDRRDCWWSIIPNFRQVTENSHPADSNFGEDYPTESKYAPNCVGYRGLIVTATLRSLTLPVIYFRTSSNETMLKCGGIYYHARHCVDWGSQDTHYWKLNMNYAKCHHHLKCKQTSVKTTWITLSNKLFERTTASPNHAFCWNFRNRG